MSDAGRAGLTRDSDPGRPLTSVRDRRHRTCWQVADPDQLEVSPGVTSTARAEPEQCATVPAAGQPSTQQALHDQVGDHDRRLPAGMFLAVEVLGREPAKNGVGVHDWAGVDRAVVAGFSPGHRAQSAARSSGLRDLRPYRSAGRPPRLSAWDHRLRPCRGTRSTPPR